MAPGPLAQVLCQLPKFDDPDLLTRAIPFADAGIYRIADDLALVQSVDFFTPVVNDPTTYGRIAAANALSDIYAVGGRPVTALNLVGFPKKLDHEILIQILKGGAEKVLEAGAVIAGGHTVDDEEPKYGLAVTGLVDPRRMVTTVGARPGDRLVLTKPLGTGILASALKGGVVGEDEIREAIDGMTRLNRQAAKAMMQVGVSACTDITGFGLLGHACEMAEASGVCLALDFDSLPLYPRVRQLAAEGLIPGGSHKNRQHYLPRVVAGQDLSADMLDILADPQTSGGLLMAVAPERLKALQAAMTERQVEAWVVGEAEKPQTGLLRIY
jgi:selenide,water dikinase